MVRPRFRPAREPRARGFGRNLRHPGSAALLRVGHLDLLDTAGGWSVFAGDPARTGSADGTRSTATFQGQLYPAWIGDTLFVSDRSSSAIRRIAPDGAVTTLALHAGVDVDGKPVRIPFGFGGPLVGDERGNLYLANDASIWKIAPDGAASIVAGTPFRTGVGFGALPGSLDVVGGLALDTNGALFATSGSGVVKITLP